MVLAAKLLYMCSLFGCNLLEHLLLWQNSKYYASAGNHLVASKSKLTFAVGVAITSYSTMDVEWCGRNLKNLFHHSSNLSRVERTTMMNSVVLPFSITLTLSALIIFLIPWYFLEIVTHFRFPYQPLFAGSFRMSWQFQVSLDSSTYFCQACHYTKKISIS